MKIKVNTILFILLIISYCFTSNDRGENGSSLIKYGSLIVCIAFEIYCYFSHNTGNRMKNEYKGLLIFAAVITCYSVLRSVLVLHFSFRTIQELLFLVCPMIYGYLVINNWGKKDVYNNFKYGVTISFICYLLSLDMNFRQIYAAFLQANFGESTSELESFTFCGLALAFFLYFCYYDKKKVYIVISFLFVLMTFKRLFIAIALLLLLLARFKYRDKSVPTKVINISIILLFLFGIAYYFLLQPDMVRVLEMKYSIDISELTTTRSDRMRWLINSNYESYGFGSSTEYMYKYFYGALEMDFNKVIIELGFIPAFIFVAAYIRFAKANTYVFIFMCLMLVNLIMSSGLTGTFAWCVIFITISMISIYPEKKSNSINKT